MSTSGFKRVVTGHDARGRAVIAMQGPPPNVFPLKAVPGTVFYEIWNTAGAPARVDSGPDPTLKPLELAPPARGSLIRVVDIPPDSVQNAVSAGEAAAAFAEIGASHAGTGGRDSPHRLMHRTETVDYGIVLSGKLWLVLDEGEVELGPGDIVVQRGTNHAWSNRTEETARMVFVLLDGSSGKVRAEGATSVSYLRNAWYVAAWSSEVQPGRTFARVLLDEPVVIYRDADGRAAALIDRCPHRFAPLSMGRLVEGALQCPYHGLRFDRAGACKHNPHGPVPRVARVRSFPTVERYSAIWVWMGDPERADESAIPEFDFLVPEHWFVGTGYMAIDAGYELEIDNILDLSHIEFLHPIFASEAVSRGELRCSQEGETVWSRRYIRGDSPPPFIYQAFGIPSGGLVDRWLDVRWDAPALMALWTGGVVADQPKEQGANVPSAHLFTPESATRTHYFYAMSFPRSLGEAGEVMARESAQVLRGPFENEDKPIIEAVARAMGGNEFWSLNPVLLKSDEAAVRARRILAKKIAAE